MNSENIHIDPSDKSVNMVCATCLNNVNDCPGHYGVTSHKVMHALFINNIITLISSCEFALKGKLSPEYKIMCKKVNK
jgi:hypothetical protein